MSYRFADSLWAGANASAHKLSTNLYGIYHCCVYGENPDDGQRNCPKHVEFHSKNKFDKLVHLFGFIIRKLSDILLFYRLWHNKKINVSDVCHTDYNSA